MMPWVRLDDQIFLHPKIVAAGKDATLLHLSALTYASSQLTDGFIPAASLRVVAFTVNVNPKHAATLVEVGIWESVEGGYRIHDYLEYNPSAEKIRGERADAKARMQRLRSANVRPNKERSSPEVRDSHPHPHPIPSSLRSEESERPSRNGSERDNGHAPPRSIGNLIPLPDPFENDTPEMEAWVRERKMPFAWVNNRTDSFVARYRESGEIKTVQAWQERFKKWLLDDWAKERQSGLAAKR